MWREFVSFFSFFIGIFFICSTLILSKSTNSSKLFHSHHRFRHLSNDYLLYLDFLRISVFLLYLRWYRKVFKSFFIWIELSSTLGAKMIVFDLFLQLFFLSPVQQWISWACTCAKCDAAWGGREGAWAGRRRARSTRYRCYPGQGRWDGRVVNVECWWDYNWKYSLEMNRNQFCLRNECDILDDSTFNYQGYNEWAAAS